MVEQRAGGNERWGVARLVVDFEKSLSKHKTQPPHIAMRREAARAAARAASLASSRVCHPVTTTPRGGFASSSSSFAKSKTKRAPKPRDPPPGTTTSIAGDATREYLVKLPAQEMAAEHGIGLKQVQQLFISISPSAVKISSNRNAQICQRCCLSWCHSDAFGSQ